MRFIIAISIITLLCGSSLAKHDEDHDDDNSHRQKHSVTVVEPLQKTVVIVPPPPPVIHRHVVRGAPQIHVNFAPLPPSPIPRVTVGVRFTDNHRKVVREYYRVDYPKRHKRHMAPPGWRKRIIIGRCIPRDIILYPIPEELEIQLPPLPRFYVRSMVGNGIIIRDIRTGYVVDACFDDD